MKIIIIGALAESLVNFRGDLIRVMAGKGYEIVAMSAPTDSQRVAEIESLGCRFVPFSLARSGVNPFVDLKTYRELKAVLSVEKPQIVIAYTIKPVVWAGIASRLFPTIKFYPLITGLGYIFNRKGIRTYAISKIIEKLFRVSFRHAERVIFQNNDDLKQLVDKNLLQEELADKVNGSGVNLQRFSQSEVPQSRVVFLLVARLIEEKGVREFYEAAKCIKRDLPNVHFQLLGQPAESANAIPLSEINRWHTKGTIEYLGESNDVRSILDQASVFVLPSYYGEGVPVSILEALAVGRPIVTTQNVGCRDTVIENVNGILVEKRSAASLEAGLRWMLENKDRWKLMGNKSRELSEERFDVELVNKDLMEIFGL